MFRELFESKPKDFVVSLERPGSKLYRVGNKGYSKMVISVDEENYNIMIGNNVLIDMSDPAGDWFRGWGWDNFGKNASTKIEKMIKHLKELDV